MSETKRSIMQDYRNTVPSKVTLKNHEAKLRTFFHYWKTPGKDLDEQATYWADKAKEDREWAENEIIAFFNFQKTRIESGEITSGDTVRKSRDAVKHLCRVKRILLDWDYINMFLPKAEKGTYDRSYTLNEIRKILTYPDRRIKPIVLLMASCGMSVGSFERLKKGDIEPISKDGEVLCARIHLYRGKTSTRYTSYITPEAYDAVREYLEWRSDKGEQITDDSSILRNIFGESGAQGMKARANNPLRLSVATIDDIVENALRAAELRPPKSKKGQRGPYRKGHRYAVKQNHGFRKFFSDIAGKYMQPDGVLLARHLIGHSIGLFGVYPLVNRINNGDDLAAAYLQAVPYLTIDEQRKKNYLGKQELEAKDKDLKELTVQQNVKISSLETTLSRLSQKLEESERRSEWRWKQALQLSEGVQTMSEHESKMTTEERRKLKEIDESVFARDEQKMELELREIDREAAEQQAEDNEQFRRSLKAKSK